MRDGASEKTSTAPSAAALLAANVQRLRQQGRWSARAFSQHAGIGRNTLHSIESGESKAKGIELATVDKLARALGVDVSSLFAQEKAKARPWSGTGSIGRVGPAIKRLRGRRGVTQEALAASAMIPRQVLAEIEAQTRLPTLGTLERIAAALGTAVGALVSEVD